MPSQLQRYASSLASYRVLLYTGLSVGAVFAVIVNALKKHSNFYSVAVYLSKSNGSVVVLANVGLLLALLVGRLLQQIFFGPLRAMEVERLYDRMWFFVTESLLAFTIFRDEFDIPFALMFGLLLFTKCFHWLLSDRIEWMDQRPYPGPPLLFHIRINALIWLLWATDLVVFLLTIESMVTQGVGGTVLFASEYAILLASLGNSVAKYAISLYDLRRASLRGGENAPPWEDKSMLVFYVELVTDFVKLVTYMTFFMIVLTFYGLPLNIVRDVYITARSFIMRFRDLLRYRTATRNMDERYPNATEEELNSMSDRTCIICRDEMVHPSGTPPEAGGTAGQIPTSQDGPNTTPKKLPCGHIFHFYCLRSWLERQQSCPTCRRSVLEENQTPQGNNQAGPARVQPDAVPQAPNGLAPAQPFQWQPNQQANRGGFLGRIIGAAGMPPIGHGQFPPMPFPGQAPQPNGNGILNQQELPPMFAPPLNYPQPIPGRRQRFAGFFGPDGVWHAWPQAPENPNDAATRRQPAEASTPTPTTTESNAEQSSGTNQVSPSMNGSATDAGSPSEPTSASAREAAAAAALRRLSPGNGNTPTSRTPSVETSQAPLHSEARASNGNNGSSSSSRSSESHSLSDPQRRVQAPALIPLFDPHIAAPPLTRTSLRVSLGRSGSNLPNGPHQRTERIPGIFRRQGTRELPPVLTDEQLRVFDRLTREAIDERLRVLENVQQLTNRCITDLLRCRSMLPRSTSAPSAAPPTPPDAAPNEDERHSKEKTRLDSDESVGSGSGTSNLQSPERVTADA